MKKKSSIVAGPAIHTIQNTITRSKYLKPKKSYFKSFLRGRTGKSYKGRSESFKEGLTSSTISPEFDMINKHMQDLGEKTKDITLDKRNLVRLRSAARGNLKPGDANKVKDSLLSLPKEVKDGISKVTGTNVNLLKDTNPDQVVKAFNNTKSLRVFDSIFKKAPKPSGISIKSEDTFRRIGKSTGLTATTLADPFAGAVNAKKMFLANSKYNKLPGAKQVHKAGQDFFYKNPVKKEFKRGLKGKKRGKIKTQFDEFIVSPVIRDAKDFANALGGSMNKTALNTRLTYLKPLLKKDKKRRGKNKPT